MNGFRLASIVLEYYSKTANSNKKWRFYFTFERSKSTTIFGLGFILISQDSGYRRIPAFLRLGSQNIVNGFCRRCVRRLDGMGVNIGGRGRPRMAQPPGDGAEVHSGSDQQGRVCMPIGYNKDLQGWFLFRSIRS